MKDKSIGQEVLERIKDKQIKPIPRWEFLLKNYLLIGLGITSLLIGALSVAVIMYMVVNNDWDLYLYATNSFLAYLLATLPYLWMLLFIIFGALAYINIKKSKQGYKYDFIMLIVSFLLSTFILGAIFYGFGLGKFIDKTLINKVPIYERFMMHRKIWQKPDQGVLEGMIVEIKDEGIYLEDLYRKVWGLEFTDGSPFMDKIKIGDRVILIGEALENDIFQADFVRPFLGRKMKPLLDCRSNNSEFCPMRERMMPPPAY